MTAHRSQDDPDTLIVLERWTSPEAQDAYSAMRAEQFKAGAPDISAVLSNLAGAPSMRRLDDVAA